MSAESDGPSPFMRLRDASPLLNTPVSTLRRLCARKLIPSEKIGRAWQVKRAYVDYVTAWAPPAQQDTRDPASATEAAAA